MIAEFDYGGQPVTLNFDFNPTYTDAPCNYCKSIPLGATQTIFPGFPEDGAGTGIVPASWARFAESERTISRPSPTDKEDWEYRRLIKHFRQRLVPRSVHLGILACRDAWYADASAHPGMIIRNPRN